MDSPNSTSITPIKHNNERIITTTTTNLNYSDSDSEDEDDVVIFGNNNQLLNTPGKDHIYRRETLIQSNSKRGTRLLIDRTVESPLIQFYHDPTPITTSNTSILDETPSPIKEKHLISPLIPLGGTPLSWRQENISNHSSSSKSSSNKNSPSSNKKFAPLKRFIQDENNNNVVINCLRSPSSRIKTTSTPLPPVFINSKVEVEEEEEEEIIPETTEEESIVVVLSEVEVEEELLSEGIPEVVVLDTSSVAQVDNSESGHEDCELEEALNQEEELEPEEEDSQEEEFESEESEIESINNDESSEEESESNNDNEVDDDRYGDVTMKISNLGILPEDEIELQVESEEEEVEEEEESYELEEVVVEEAELDLVNEEVEEVEEEMTFLSNVGEVEKVEEVEERLVFEGARIEEPVEVEVEDQVNVVDLDDTLDNLQEEEIDSQTVMIDLTQPSSTLHDSSNSNSSPQVSDVQIVSEENEELLASQDSSIESDNLEISIEDTEVEDTEEEEESHSRDLTTEEVSDHISEMSIESLDLSSSSSASLPSENLIDVQSPQQQIPTPQTPLALSSPPLTSRLPQQSTSDHYSPPIASTSSLTPSSSTENRAPRNAWAPPVVKRQLTKYTSRIAKGSKVLDSEIKVQNGSLLIKKLPSSSSTSIQVVRTSPITSSTIKRSTPPAGTTLTRTTKDLTTVRSVPTKVRSPLASISSHTARIQGASKITINRATTSTKTSSLPPPTLSRSISSTASTSTSILPRPRTILPSSTNIKLPGSSTASRAVVRNGLSIPRRLNTGTVPKLPISAPNTSRPPSSNGSNSSSSSIPPPTSRFVSATAGRSTATSRPPFSTTTSLSSRVKPSPTINQIQSVPLVQVKPVEVIPLVLPPSPIIEEVEVNVPVIVTAPLPQLPRPLPKLVDNATNSPKRRALRVWEAPEKVIKENTTGSGRNNSISTGLAPSTYSLHRSNSASVIPNSTISTRPPLVATLSLNIRPVSSLSISPLPSRVANSILSVSAEKLESSTVVETFGKMKAQETEVVVVKEVETVSAPVPASVEVVLLSRPVRKPKVEPELEIIPVLDPIVPIVPLPRPTRKRIILPPSPTSSESIEEVLYPITPARPPPIFIAPPSLTSDELTQLTQKNTRKNKIHFNKLDVQTIYMESNRPPSPTSKIRRSLGNEGNGPTTKAGREARAAKRRSALRSSIDGTAERMLSDELGEIPNDFKEVEEEKVLIHFRAPGDEEEFKSPVKVDRKVGKNGKGKKVEEVGILIVSKSVKWDKALVYEEVMAAPGDMVQSDGIIKRVPLDSFGNSRATSTGFAKPASVSVTKLIFKDDE